MRHADTPEAPRDPNQLAKLMVDHGSLRRTPAMAAGVSKRLWDISDMVQVIEDWEARKPMGMAA